MKLLFGNALFPVNDVHILVMPVIRSGWTGNDITQCLDVVTDRLILLFLWF